MSSDVTYKRNFRHKSTTIFFSSRIWTCRFKMLNYLHHRNSYLFSSSKHWISTFHSLIGIEAFSYLLCKQSENERTAAELQLLIQLLEKKKERGWKMLNTIFSRVQCGILKFLLTALIIYGQKIGLNWNWWEQPSQHVRPFISFPFHPKRKSHNTWVKWKRTNSFYVLPLFSPSPVWSKTNSSGFNQQFASLAFSWHTWDQVERTKTL